MSGPTYTSQTHPTVPGTGRLMAGDARPRPVTVAIVADDLTGANDSAAQFAREGWRTRLALGNSLPDQADGRSVLGVVTDSRSQGGEQARISTASAVAALSKAGFERIFVKIDSTMRGSVADQIVGALNAWSEHDPDALAVVCPAYPAMGRTVADGRILVNGAGVETTAIGRDPVTPVTTSDFSQLLPGSVSVRLRPGSVGEHAKQIEAARIVGSRIVVIDASTDEELKLVADAIDHMGAQAIPVGAAGLARAMAAVWAGSARCEGYTQPIRRSGEAERVLVVISSLHDVAQHQCEALINSMPPDEIRIIAPSLETVLDPVTARAWMLTELADVAEMPRVILVTTPSQGSHHTSGAPPGRSPARTIALSLAEIAGAVLEDQLVGALVLVGGDGARAVLQYLGARTILVSATLREGVPLGVIEGGRANGLQVVTKGGGFGDNCSLVAITHELRHHHR